MRLINDYSSLIRITPDFLFTQVCSNPRESQCTYFCRCDDAKSPDNSATTPVKNDTKPTDNLSTAQAATGATYEQKSQQSSLTGLPCKCNLASIQRTTIKEGPNQGRNFWVSSDQFIKCHNHLGFSVFFMFFSFLALPRST